MKRRNFFTSFAALALMPWRIAKDPETVEVFPTKREQLIGLMVVDGIKPEVNRYVITSEAEQEFKWQGSDVNNYRRNKYWGYRVGDPEKVPTLLCIEKWDLYPESGSIRFYKV